MRLKPLTSAEARAFLAAVERLDAMSRGIPQAPYVRALAELEATCGAISAAT